MLLEILVPVAVFTTLVLALTLLVFLARRRLEPSGNVVVTLNTTRSLELPAGEKLLFALAAQGIYLPAACGGRGTCGQCRITVTSGGRPLLPTEEPHIGPEEARAGVRLACMLKLREPVAVRLPDEILTVRRLSGIVASARNVATYLREIVITPESPLEFEAGDYLLVEAPPYRIDFSELDIHSPYRDRWQDQGLLELKSHSRALETRAYSLAGSPAEPARLVLLVKIALPPPAAPAGTPPGRVSSYLFALAPGDTVAIRGPYGNLHVRDTDCEMVLIGGGAGLAPLRSIVLDQLAKHCRRRMSLWYGAREVDDLCFVNEFEAAAAAHENFSYHVALSSTDADEHWSGYKGFIHAVAHEHYLKDHPAPASVEYYLCGPPLMTSATLHMLERLGVPRENILFDDFGS
jgi:Na+-transporting NADH:ubiquinone oxidoreductase subunit F